MTIDLSPESIRAAALTLPGDRPIQMLNLIRYRDQADYGERIDLAPQTGREAYFGRYVPAFTAVAAELETAFKPIWVGQVLTALVGSADERWDDVAVVEYPTFAAFRRIVESRQYAVIAAPHRRAAQRDWRLIATVPMDLPE